MQVICLEEAAFYTLVEEVVARLSDKQERHSDKWISGEEAMKLLQIKSKTSLQNLRDSGKIRYSQPQRKIIIYDRESILAYLETNAKNTF
ncbi:MAG: DNA-binding protein [Bacteroidetes bacterium 46-16]|nr:MAG: DNA-binding protein [Bacteroidetes bacterium 46-16]